MTSFLVALGLFGGLLGMGGQSDCAAHEEQAALAMREIRQQWPLRGSLDPVSVYTRDLGRRLIAASGLGPASEWSFQVVRNLEPGAFALGGGYILVSDSLIVFVRDESDFAAVLAHEIAHQALGHFCRRSSARTEQIDLGTVVQHFDVELEKEADAKAVELLAAAGFDADAMASVLRCLMQRRSAVSSADLRSRVEAVRQQSKRVRSYPRVRPDSSAFASARESVREDLGSHLLDFSSCRN